MIRRGGSSGCATRIPCSTPGGIETVISRHLKALGHVQVVLNARRHRDGDQLRDENSSRNLNVVLNARRHRDGDQPARVAALPLVARAQRPEASRR